MKRKPNILWICTDQQRRDTLGCYGNPFTHTPNIDALAAEGVKLNGMYSQSPVCAPARASFLSGRYPPDLRRAAERTEHPRDGASASQALCGLRLCVRVIREAPPQRVQPVRVSRYGTPHRRRLFLFLLVPSSGGSRARKLDRQRLYQLAHRAWTGFSHRPLPGLPVRAEGHAEGVFPDDVVLQ